MSMQFYELNGPRDFDAFLDVDYENLLREIFLQVPASVPRIYDAAVQEVNIL